MNIQNRSFLCSVMLMVVASAEAVPKDLLDGLSSDDFKQREASQLGIEKWVDEKGLAAVAEIYKLYTVTDDPEVRSRCFRVLRTQSDKDYLDDGKGYLGVQMREEVVEIPGDEKPRYCIRITLVQPGSQAELGGIKVGDLIASMDGGKWYNQDAILEFSKLISSYKPRRKVMFEVIRAGQEKLLEIPIILGKRPVEDMNLLYYNDPMKLDKDARDKHFNEWLEKQKQAK
jgi:predicted metalloprotease with PDZ domain